MKRYAIVLLASAFVFSLAVSAQDQTQGQPQEGKQSGFEQNQMPPQSGKRHHKAFKQAEKPKLSAQKRAGYLAVDLELTDVQRAKVQALFEKQEKARESRLAEMKKIHEQEIAKVEAEKKANDAEMEKILGAEKFKQFKAAQTERQQKLEGMKKRMMARMNDQNQFGERRDIHQRGFAAKGNAMRRDSLRRNTPGGNAMRQNDERPEPVLNN